MSLQVGKAIYNLLSNDANVTGRVQNKIYPLIADTGTTFPFIYGAQNEAYKTIY